MTDKQIALKKIGELVKTTGDLGVKCLEEAATKKFSYIFEMVYNYYAIPKLIETLKDEVKKIEDNMKADSKCDDKQKLAYTESKKNILNRIHEMEVEMEVAPRNIDIYADFIKDIYSITK